MTFKNIFTLLILLLLCVLYSLLVIKGIENQNLQLDKLTHYRGATLDIGQTIRTSGKYDTEVFFIKLSGLDQPLGVYRQSKEYQSLINQIKIGDTIDVYYIDGAIEDVNIDLVQIELNKKIILNKQEYESKESSLIWIGTIAFILTMIFGVRHIMKNMIPKKLKAFR